MFEYLLCILAKYIACTTAFASRDKIPFVISPDTVENDTVEKKNITVKYTSMLRPTEFKYQTSSLA